MHGISHHDCISVNKKHKMIISKYIYIFPSQCLLTQKSYESRNHLCSLSAVSELSCAVLFFVLLCVRLKGLLQCCLCFYWFLNLIRLFFNSLSLVLQFSKNSSLVFYMKSCVGFLFVMTIIFENKTCIYLKNIKHIYNDKWNANTQCLVSVSPHYDPCIEVKKLNASAKSFVQSRSDRSQN